MSQFLKFEIENLASLDDGKACAAFEKHVMRAALDCLDRPADPKPRSVTLQVDIVPVLEPGGDCTEVKLTIQAASKVPVHRTKEYSMGLRRGGMLIFNPSSLGNVNQGTFTDHDDDKE